MHNNLTFLNLQLAFFNIGDVNRRSNKFIDIFSTRGKSELKSDEKILGRWYVTEVRHIFFADLYTKAQTVYQQKISFKLNKDKLAHLSYWQFASWQSVKRQIQLDLAQQLVNPNAHAHMEPVQFSVQLTSNSELSVVQPKLPSHWGKVLVIASKPQQRWVDSTESSQWIKF